MYKVVFLLALITPGVFGVCNADDDSFPSVVPDTFKDLERAAIARSREKSLENAAKEKYFVDSFNRLAAALDEFSKTYKATHAVDLKQVKSIRDAYRKLEKADPLFRPE